MNNDKYMFKIYCILFYNKTKKMNITTIFLRKKKSSFFLFCVLKDFINIYMLVGQQRTRTWTHNEYKLNIYIQQVKIGVGLGSQWTLIIVLENTLKNLIVKLKIIIKRIEY